MCTGHLILYPFTAKKYPHIIFFLWNGKKQLLLYNIIGCFMVHFIMSNCSRTISKHFPNKRLGIKAICLLTLNRNYKERAESGNQRQCIITTYPFEYKKLALIFWTDDVKRTDDIKMNRIKANNVSENSHSIFFRLSERKFWDRKNDL